MKKILVVFLILSILIMPVISFSQSINPGITINQIGSSIAQWSGGSRLIPTLIQAGSAAAWIISGLSTPAVCLIAAGFLFSYVINNSSTIAGVGAWLASKDYVIQDGIYKRLTMNKLIPFDSPQYAPMWAELAKIGYGGGGDAAGYETQVSMNNAINAYLVTLQSFTPDDESNYAGSESSTYDAGSDYWYKAEARWNTHQDGHVYGQPVTHGVYHKKYFYTCFKNSGGVPTPFADTPVYVPVAETAALAAAALAADMAVDFAAGGEQQERVKAMWLGMETVLSAGISNSSHGLNVATTATAGISPVKIARDELNKGIPDAVKVTFIGGGTLPVPGEPITPTLPTTPLDPPIIPIDTPITGTYVKTAWATVGNFGAQWVSFKTSVMSTGLFALPAILTTGMPTSGGNPVITFDAGSLGVHSYDFSSSAWIAIMLVVRVLILLMCSVIAVRIIILKR